MFDLIVLIALLLVATNLTGATRQANAEAVPCTTPLVSVETSDEYLSQRVCQVVAAALPMLDKCHLELNYSITIGFSDASDSSEISCLGLYHMGEGKIDLLKPNIFAEVHAASQFCRSIPLSEHFDSIIVHEFTHAVLDQSTCLDDKCLADQEYIAYAMQFSSLTPSTRENFLAQVGTSSPVSVESLNSVILAFSPSVFAARVWLHFSEPTNGCDFVGKLVRGETTLWMEPE